MTLREIFRFEFTYQARRVRTWLYFAVLFVVAYLIVREGSIDGARDGGALVNSPYVIALTTVISSLLWAVMAAPVAASAAARDVQTRMHALVYATPITDTDYVGGRFLAALALNAMILLAVPAGTLAAVLVPGIAADLLGPFRPAAYVSTYVFVGLPTAFAVTALQFSFATVSRRAIATYLGSVLFSVVVSFGAGAVINLLNMPTLGKLLDPIGYVTVVGLLSKTWTPNEMNTVLVGLERSMLAKGLLWIGIGLGALTLTRLRFRFRHRGM